MNEHSDSPLTEQEIAERRRKLADLVRRGLVVLHQQDDGTAEIEYVQPDHPEIIAFFGIGPAINTKFRVVVHALIAAIKSADQDKRQFLADSLDSLGEHFSDDPGLEPGPMMFADLMEAMEDACEDDEE